MNKQEWLNAAEIFDAWRVVPRTVLFMYATWLAHVTNNILLWYQHLPAAERTVETAGLTGAIITAITGLATWIYKIYSENGRDWSQQQGTQP
jgi:hypothetical protein